MQQSGVASLQLKLHIASELADDAARLRQRAERELLVRVLDALEVALDARFGRGAVIRVRRVQLKWSIEEGELASQSIAEQLARDLAASIAADLERLSPSERLRPRSTERALFASSVHEAAAYLADAADARPAHWLYAEYEGAAETWRAVLERGTEALIELTAWLTKMERLEQATAFAPWSELVAAAKHVPALALHVARREPLQAHDAASTAVDSAAAAATPPSTQQAATDSSSLHAADAQRERHEDHDEDPAAAAAQREVSTERGPACASAHRPKAFGAEPAPAGVIRADTQGAGLFYLVKQILELGIAERLWSVGVSEGDVLAALGSRIVGSRDIAAAWFGGCYERAPALPAIPEWAADEVCERVQHELGVQLAKRKVIATVDDLQRQLREQTNRHPPERAWPRGLSKVVSQVEAALSIWTAASLGRAVADTTLQELCIRPGLLLLTPDTLHVMLPEQALDLANRRAGLDQNPGHAPWLARRVEIEFDCAEVW